MASVERQYQNELDDLTEQLGRWKKALYSVTPGTGSECIDDPEFCAASIRDTQQTQHRMIVNLTIRNRELESVQKADKTGGPNGH